MSVTIPFNVPIVGQTFDVGQCDVVATVTCRCAPGNPAMLIRSTMMVAQCARCRAQYLITFVAFDRRKEVEARVVVERVPDGPLISREAPAS